MGWLGYTEQATLDTSIPALEGALEAAMEFQMLAMRGQFAPVAAAPPPPTSESIFGAFRAAAAPVRP